ncbi:MAG: SufD family Fe-S cluster assembly protein, partial [Leptospiraceae bacterium]|nr:SufD family Fe-S cluster assembly protein [Leptospiraceae bacterium]
VIRAEDVSCEHGATVGELDKDALFFLMARGLTEEQARTLLIEGFLTGVIEEIPLDAGQIEIFLQEMKDKLAL